MNIQGKIRIIQQEWADFMLGDRLFIDVANSLYDGSGRLPDPFDGWAEALTYIEMAGGLKPEEAKMFQKLASGREASGSLSDLQDLRRLVERMISAMENGQHLSRNDIAIINTNLVTLDGGLRLAAQQNKYAYNSIASEPSLPQVLGLICKSVADFTVYDDFKRLKKSGNDDCPLYFYDTSKNGQRRWCRMDVCGNRAKARAHYHRENN